MGAMVACKEFGCSSVNFVDAAFFGWKLGSELLPENAQINRLRVYSTGLRISISSLIIGSFGSHHFVPPRYIRRKYEKSSKTSETGEHPLMTSRITDLAVSVSEVSRYRLSSLEGRAKMRP
jgi:hypothetical protein